MLFLKTIFIIFYYMDTKYYIYKLACDDVCNFLYINYTKNPTQKKRYYKDNTFLTYKLHKNESLYKTIRENGGWENWRFIIIDEVTCNKYQIHNVCEQYRKIELNSLDKFKRDILDCENINSGRLNQHTNRLVKNIKSINIESPNLLENTKIYNKIQKNTMNSEFQNKNTNENFEQDLPRQSILSNSSNNELLENTHNEYIQYNNNPKILAVEKTQNINNELKQGISNEYILTTVTNNDEEISKNTNNESMQDISNEYILTTITNNDVKLSQNTNNNRLNEEIFNTEIIQQNTSNQNMSIKDINEKELIPMEDNYNCHLSEKHYKDSHKNELSKDSSVALEESNNLLQYSKYHENLNEELEELKKSITDIKMYKRNNSLKYPLRRSKLKTLKCKKNIFT